MTVRVEHADMLEAIPRLVAEGVMVDAVVTDPPYGLEFMGKEWDSFADVRKATRGTLTNMVNPNGAEKFKTKAPAFDLSSQGRASYQEWTEAWARAALTILKPGGYLLAFGGTRTFHRMVSGLEDAGFVIQDTIAWVYGSGFPKNKSLLKPAFEPVCLAYKPGGKRTMQVDECRVAGEGNKTFNRFPGDRARDQYRTGTTGGAIPSDLGRWPANICHDGSDEVLAAFPDGRSAGIYPSDSWGTGNGTTYAQKKPQGPLYDDSGSAARFFYCAKAGKEDRAGSKHPTVKPVDLIAWLVKLVTPASVDVLKCIDCGYEIPYDHVPRVRQDISANEHQKGDVLNSVSQSSGGTGRQDSRETRMSNVRDNVSSGDAREQVLLPELQGNKAKKAAPNLPAVRGAFPSSNEERKSPEILFDHLRGNGSDDKADADCLRGMRNNFRAKEGREPSLLLGEVRDNMERSQTAEAITRSEGLRPDPRPRASNGEQSGICDAAPIGDGGGDREASVAERGRASQERDQGRQPDRKSGINDQATARQPAENSQRNDRVSVLRGGSADIECCSHCGGRIVWTKRPGIFLDPFAGSGTAAVAALKTGRNAILIEREDQYVAGIRERVAFYEGLGLHSAAAKHRNRKVDDGPLFAPAYDAHADALGSYEEAIRCIGEDVKAGKRPVPEFMLGEKR